MPFAASVVSVLVASPSDVQAERDALRTAVWDFNDEHASALQVVLLPVLWETHARPELGTEPQALLDQQIVDGADVVIGVFWTRAGSKLPDGTFATVHELERLVEAGKPALLYFSSQPAVPSMIDPEQLVAVQAIKDRAQAWGLYGEYDSVAGLVERVRRDLLRTVRERLSLPTPTAPSSVSAAAARPIATVRRERLQKFDSKGRPRTSTNHYLVISNAGQETAHDVIVKWADEEDGAAEALPQVLGVEEPIAHLVGGAVLEFPMVVTMGTADRGDLVLQWQGTDGEPQEQRQSITI